MKKTALADEQTQLSNQDLRGIYFVLRLTRPTAATLSPSLSLPLSLFPVGMWFVCVCLYDTPSYIGKGAE